MVIVLSLFSIVLLVISFSMKNLAAIVFNSIWGLILLLNFFSSGVIDAPSNESCIAILLFLISVELGLLILAQKPVHFKNSVYYEYVLNRKLFYFINIIGIVYFIFKYTRVSIRINNTLGVFYVRYYAYNANPNYFGSTIDLYLAQHVFFALFITTAIIGITELIRIKDIKQTIGLLSVGIIEIILYSYTFMGRAPIIMYMFYLLISILIGFRNKNYNYYDSFRSLQKSKVTKRMIMIIVLLSAIYVLILSVSRFNGLSQIKKFVAIYCGGSITYFSKLFELYAPDYAPLKYVFSGIIDPIKMMINFIFGTRFSLGGNELGSIIDVGTSIGVDVKINAACTAIFYFYKELGVVGIALYGILLGFVCGTIQNNYYSRNNLPSLVMYLMSLYTLFYTYSGWSLKFLYFCLIPLIIQFMYARRCVNDE